MSAKKLDVPTRRTKVIAELMLISGARFASGRAAVVSVVATGPSAPSIARQVVTMPRDIALRYSPANDDINDDGAHLLHALRCRVPLGDHHRLRSRRAARGRPRA